MISKNSCVTVFSSIGIALLFLFYQNCDASEAPTVSEVENKIDFIQYDFNWNPNPDLKKNSYFGVIEVNSLNGKIVSTSTAINSLEHAEWLLIKNKKHNNVILKSTFIRNDFKTKKALFQRKVSHNGSINRFDASEYDFMYVNKPLFTDAQRKNIAKVVKSNFHKELKESADGAYIILTGERMVEGKKMSSKIVWFLFEA